MIMAGSIEVVRRVIDIPQMSARKRFGRYKRESIKASRKARVKESEVLRQLKDAYRRFEWEHNSLVNFQRLLRGIGKLRSTARDVEEFSLALEGFQHEDGFIARAGVFLSALVFCGRDSDYMIHTRHLDIALNDLGLLNIKNMTIEGDAGCDVGAHMIGGRVTVNGNVNGDAGYKIQGGEIWVEGDFIGIPYLLPGYTGPGRLYHKGNLIRGK
jgi:hypothetical protein